jgi:hypothetical protein
MCLAEGSTPAPTGYDFVLAFGEHGLDEITVLLCGLRRERKLNQAGPSGLASRTVASIPAGILRRSKRLATTTVVRTMSCCSAGVITISLRR